MALGSRRNMAEDVFSVHQVSVLACKVSRENGTLDLKQKELIRLLTVTLEVSFNFLAILATGPRQKVE